jgi:hypothetical protein
MFIRFDGRPPRVLSDQKNNAVHYTCDKNGFPVYIADKEYVRQVCTQKSDRYRLYKSEPLDVQAIDIKTGAIKRATINPWFYTVSFVDDGIDPENQERKTKKVISWVEDTKGSTAMPATIETILEKTRDYSEDESYLLRQANKGFAKENSALKDLVAELSAKLEAVIKKVEELSVKPAPVVQEDAPKAPESTGPLKVGVPKK